MNERLEKFTLSFNPLQFISEGSTSLSYDISLSDEIMSDFSSSGYANLQILSSRVLIETIQLNHRLPFLLRPILPSIDKDLETKSKILTEEFEFERKYNENCKIEINFHNPDGG